MVCHPYIKLTRGFISRLLIMKKMNSLVSHNMKDERKEKDGGYQVSVPGTSCEEG